MKNKLNWVLIPALLFIWGLIGWRGYKSFSHSSDNTTQLKGKVIIDQTFSRTPGLMDQNYRSPFGRSKAINSPQNISQARVNGNSGRQSRAYISNQPNTIINKNPIQLLGIIKNDKEVNCILKYQGQLYTRSVGDSIAHYKISQILNSSVRLKNGKESQILEFQD